MSGKPLPAQLAESLLDEVRRLRRAVDELSILNDLARAIGASLNGEEIMQIIIRRSLRAVNAEQGVITLVEEEQKSMKTLILWGFSLYRNDFDVSREGKKFAFTRTFEVRQLPPITMKTFWYHSK